MDLLPRLGQFSQFPINEHRALAYLGLVSNVPAGQDIAHEGDCPTFLIIGAKAKVTIWKLEKSLERTPNENEGHNSTDIA